MTPKKPKAKKKAKPVTREIVKKVAEWIGKSSA
jgi:hypothetical protein